jgi:hypothetical protein
VDSWVGGLAWYDSWFGSTGSGVQIASGPPYLILIRIRCVMSRPFVLNHSISRIKSKYQDNYTSEEIDDASK